MAESKEGVEPAHQDRTLKIRMEKYINNPPICMVNIIGHGSQETYDDVLKEYENTLHEYIYFNALFLSPVEQCLLNVSTKNESQCTNLYSRWGKTQVFLKEFLESKPSESKPIQSKSSDDIITNINTEISGMQGYYVLSHFKNIEILKNPEHARFARMPQGKGKIRTPSNQFISFDCISSIDYVNYCYQLAGANYTCLDNEFSGLILPLIILSQTPTLYTTGYDEKSIKMNIHLLKPRVSMFADFSLFCDICAIQHMNPTYFDIIKKLLQIRKTLGYNIIIQEIKMIPPCVPCESIYELTSLPLPDITFDTAGNYKIINIDLETIMMLFVLFLLISNNNVYELSSIERAMASDNLPNIFTTIDNHSLYPIDLLSYACRPGRENIKRFLTELAEGQIPRRYITASSYNSDSDDESDAATVINDDDDPEPIVKDVIKDVDNLLIRRSARVANRSENTGEQGSFYISTPIQREETIQRIVTNLMKKDASTRTIILRYSLRLAEKARARARAEEARARARQSRNSANNNRSKPVYVLPNNSANVPYKSAKRRPKSAQDLFKRGGKRTKSQKRQKTRKQTKRTKRSNKKRSKGNKRNKTSKRKKHN